MNRPARPIRLDILRQFPARPESEFEWEDLLLRLELMPRALKVEIEAGSGDEVPEILAAAIDRELVVQQLLEEVALDTRPRTSPSLSTTVSSELPETGPDTVHPSPNPPAESLLSEGTADAAVDRFVRLRGRNFAMLQRRGIDVWNWAIRLPPDGDATVYQLLSLLARDDVEMLSRMRTARASVPGAC